MTIPSRIGGCPVYAGPAGYPPPDAAAVTLGRFDGVHLGHQALLRATIQAAGELSSGRSVAITFWPPPEWVLRPDAPRGLLTSLEDRLALLADTGVDAIIVWPFDRALAELSPEEFLRRLYDRVRMRALLTGPNARIGKDRQGTPEVMGAIGRDLGFAYRTIPWHGTPGATASSQIRGALASGDLAGVNAGLGRLHSLRAVVVRGEARGRSIGVPTANLRPPEWLSLPADGVYAGFALPAHAGAAPGRWRAVVNIGVRPTFGAGARVVEAHLLDFDGDLYDRELRLFFQSRLRDERRFPDVDALLAAIRSDLQAARELPEPDGAAFHPFATV